MKHSQIHHPNFQLNHWPTKHYLRARLRKQGQWASGNQDVCDMWVCGQACNRLRLIYRVYLAQVGAWWRSWMIWSATDPPNDNIDLKWWVIFWEHLDSDDQCIYYICPLKNNYPNLGIWIGHTWHWVSGMKKKRMWTKKQHAGSWSRQTKNMSPAMWFGSLGGVDVKESCIGTQWSMGNPWQNVSTYICGWVFPNFIN